MQVVMLFVDGDSNDSVPKDGKEVERKEESSAASMSPVGQVEEVSEVS